MRAPVWRVSASCYFLQPGKKIGSSGKDNEGRQVLSILLRCYAAAPEICDGKPAMRWLYTLLFYLGLPLILGRLYWRSRRAPAYARRWGERFGYIAPLNTEKTVVWLHTVSVGEFLGALPLIRILQQSPNLQLVITTTTPTEIGRASCRE